MSKENDKPKSEETSKPITTPKDLGDSYETLSSDKGKNAETRSDND